MFARLPHVRRNGFENNGLEKCVSPPLDDRGSGYAEQARFARSRLGIAAILATGTLAWSTGPTLGQTKPTPIKAAASEAALTRMVAVVAGDGPIDVGTDQPETTAKPRVAAPKATKNVKVRLALASFASAADILTNRAIVLSDRARADINAGIVDPRVLGSLGAVAKRYTIEVTTLRSGHSRYVKGTTRDSNHYYGRGADISKVNGIAVTKSNQAALALANYFLTLPGDIRPTEVGSPWFGDGSGADVSVFSDEGHDDHIHIGFDE